MHSRGFRLQPHQDRGTHGMQARTSAGGYGSNQAAKTKKGIKGYTSRRTAGQRLTQGRWRGEMRTCPNEPHTWQDM